MRHGQIWNFEVEVYLPFGHYQVPDEVAEELSAWCRKNCQHYWVRGSNRLYWFQDEGEAMLFSMAFSR
jgi:hypothetical protein